MGFRNPAGTEPSAHAASLSFAARLKQPDEFGLPTREAQFRRYIKITR
jgi:hypothetical protein